MDLKLDVTKGYPSNQARKNNEDEKRVDAITSFVCIVSKRNHILVTSSKPASAFTNTSSNSADLFRFPSDGISTAVEIFELVLINTKTDKCVLHVRHNVHPLPVRESINSNRRNEESRVKTAHFQVSCHHDGRGLDSNANAAQGGRNRGTR